MPTFPIGGDSPPLASVSELETLLQRTFTPAETASANLVLGIATETIRTFTRQTLSRVDNDALVIPAGWHFDMVLPERPVINVASITIDGTLLGGSMYSWYQDGRVEFPSGLGYSDARYDVASGRRATIVYSHGFDPMRADIKGICLELARSAVIAPAGGVKSESIGNYSVEFDTAAAGVLSDSQEKRLLPYRPVTTSVPIVAGSW